MRCVEETHLVTFCRFQWGELIQKLIHLNNLFILLFCAVEPKKQGKGNDNYQLCIIYFHYDSKEFCCSYQMTSPLAHLLCSKSLPVYLKLISSPKIRLEALWFISKAVSEYSRSRLKSIQCDPEAMFQKIYSSLVSLIEE